MFLVAAMLWWLLAALGAAFSWFATVMVLRFICGKPTEN
jgi:hypothetical protein